MITCKKLLFLCGPNGIGKTTIAKEIISILQKSAYVDSDPCRMMNPFALNDVSIPTIAQNISDLINNYLKCDLVETVIFSYGFHGRRKEVFEKIMENLSGLQYDFIPFLLWCDLEENIKRMNADNRSDCRIEIAINESRKAFDNIDYQRIDITSLSPQAAARAILSLAFLED